MGILVDKNTKVIVQGITGKEGRYHMALMLDYGTNIVARITPDKGGEKVCGVLVFNNFKEAFWSLELKTDDVATCVFVPAINCVTAVKEAIVSGIKLIILITEGIPLLDTLRIVSLAKRSGVTLIGPNTHGVVTADECKIGILATHFVRKGDIGVISRSGTLIAVVTQNLYKENFGVTTVVGIGGDSGVGSNFVVVIVGEIGGNLEEGDS